MAAWWAPIYFWFKFAVLIYNGCFQKFRFVKSDGINCFQDRRINSYFFPDLPIIVGLTAWLNLGWHDSFLYDQYTIWPFFWYVLDHFLDALRFWLIISLIHGDAETFWYDRPYQFEQILDVSGLIWLKVNSQLGVMKRISWVLSESVSSVCKTVKSDSTDQLLTSITSKLIPLKIYQ